MTQNELPVGWVKCTIKDIGNVVSGGTPSTKDDANFNGDIAWITPADLSKYNNKFIKRGKRNISEKGLNSSSAQLMPAGSVLFSSRAPVGYVVIAANPITTNQGFKNVVPFTGIFNEYVYYYLKSKKKRIESKASGTTFKEISGSKFSAIPFLLPPWAEQKRIVGKIEELFAEVDKGIDLLKQKQAELKKYRQSVLSAAFSGKLYKTTEWQTISLEKLVNISSGFSGKQVPYKTEFPVTRIETISKEIIDLNRIGYVEKIEDINRYKLCNGDILFSNINSDFHLGKTAVFRGNNLLYHGTNLLLLRPHTELVSPIFLNYHITYLRFQGFFIKIAQHAVNQSSINQKKLKAIVLRLPTRSEQEQIVAEIEQRFEQADKLEEILSESLSSAEKLKQSILKQAFEGKLVPQDPNDEPASVLLERIKSEQSNTPKKKGKKK